MNTAINIIAIIACIVNIIISWINHEYAYLITALLALVGWLELYRAERVRDK